MRRGPAATLAVASLGTFATFVDVTVANVVFPDIERSFPETSRAALSWVFNAYNVVFAGLLVAAGRACDVIGRRRGFELGVAVFTLASLLVAVAPSAETLIAARAVQGVGAAMLVPASLALVLHAYPAEGRNSAIAVWAAAGAVAVGLGPTVGGLLVEVDGWRLAFLVNLPVGVLTLVASRVLLEDDRVHGNRFPDLVGAAAFTGASAALTLAVVEGPRWGWGDPRTLLCLGMASALAGTALQRAERHPVPFLALGLLRLRSFALPNAISIVVSAGSYALLLTHVLFLSGAWGYSLLEAGLAITPAAFATAAAALPAGRLADRFGHRPVVVGGCALWSLSAAYFVLITPDTPAFVTGFLPAEIMHGVSVALVLPALGTAAAVEVPAHEYGVAAAMNAAARQLGAVFGVAAVVSVVGTPGPSEAADALRGGWVVALVALTAGTLWSLRLPGANQGAGRRRRRTTGAARIRRAAAPQYGRGT